MLSFGCQSIISVNPMIHTSKRCNWNKATKAQCKRYNYELVVNLPYYGLLALIFSSISNYD